MALRASTMMRRTEQDLRSLQSSQGRKAVTKHTELEPGDHRGHAQLRPHESHAPGVRERSLRPCLSWSKRDPRVGGRSEYDPETFSKSNSYRRFPRLAPVRWAQVRPGGPWP